MHMMTAKVTDQKHGHIKKVVKIVYPYTCADVGFGLPDLKTSTNLARIKLKNTSES